MMRLCRPSPVQALKTGILVRVVPPLTIGRRAKLKKKLEKYRANTPNLDFEAVISAVAASSFRPDAIAISFRPVVMPWTDARVVKMTLFEPLF
jgi:hypothetical protein